MVCSDLLPCCQVSPGPGPHSAGWAADTHSEACTPATTWCQLSAPPTAQHHHSGGPGPGKASSIAAVKECTCGLAQQSACKSARSNAWHPQGPPVDNCTSAASVASPDSHHLQHYSWRVFRPLPLAVLLAEPTWLPAGVRYAFEPTRHPSCRSMAANSRQQGSKKRCGWCSCSVQPSSLCRACSVVVSATCRHTQVA